MRKLGSASLCEASLSVILRAEGVTSRASHRGTDGLECLKEHASLEGKVQRSVDVEALTGGAGQTLHDTSLCWPLVSGTQIHIFHFGQCHDLNNERKRPPCVRGNCLDLIRA